MHNVIHELYYDEVDPVELIIYLGSRSTSASCSGHRVILHTGDLELVYKSGETRLREVLMSDSYRTNHLSQMRADIKRYLVDFEGKDRIYQGCLYSNKRIDTEYNFENFIHVLSTDPKNYGISEHHQLVNYHHPLLIEFVYKRVDDIPWLNSYRTQKVFEELMLLFSLVGQYIYGAYVFNPYQGHDQFWAINMEAPKTDLRPTWSSSMSLGFQDENKNFSEFTNRPMTDIYQKKLDLIFEVFFAASRKDRDQFLKAAYWFHAGLIDSHRSSAFMKHVIAIEAMLPNDKGSCPECGQPTFKISEKFRDFIVKHAGEEYLKIAKTAYSLRSSLAHSGQLLGYDKSKHPNLIPLEGKESHEMSLFSQAVARALIEWLFNRANESKLKKS